MLMIFTMTDMSQHMERFASRAFVSFVGFFIVIQINIRFLFPYFFLRKKQVLYYLSSVVLIAVTALLLHLKIFPWSEWFTIPPMP
ncbi:hypothetical protein N9L92_05550, partial [Saprospiraceae bacterium]|nr:hypothetical protein [Saprospiraceae bacterium]